MIRSGELRRSESAEALDRHLTSLDVDLAATRKKPPMSLGATSKALADVGRPTMQIECGRACLGPGSAKIPFPQNRGGASSAANRAKKLSLASHMLPNRNFWEALNGRLVSK
jgi:hypothetical protein